MFLRILGVFFAPLPAVDLTTPLLFEPTCLLGLARLVFDLDEVLFLALLSKPVLILDLTALSVDLTRRVLSESTIAEVVPDFLVLKPGVVLADLLLIGSTIVVLPVVLLVTLHRGELVERLLVILVELLLLNRLFVVRVLLLELITDLDEVGALDDLAVRLRLLDETKGVDTVTLLRTLVGIVRVVDLVLDCNDEVPLWFIDGACVLRDVGLEVFTDRLVLVGTVVLIDLVGLVVLALVLRLVLLFITGLEVCFDDVVLEDLLLTEGALCLVGALVVVLEGELATLAGAELADLLLRFADLDDLCPLAKHGAKSRLKINPPNTILILIFLNANMINLLSATNFLAAFLQS